MAFYTVEVDDPDGVIHSMRDLADFIANELERRGSSPTRYNVDVKGPPELRIGFVMR